MKIGYMYDDTVGLYHYGPKHPMKPFRIMVTHSLVRSFKLDNKMYICKPVMEDLTYHPKEYLDNLGINETADCPRFDGMKDFCQKYASASINAAKYLNNNLFDCVINWGGGLHHAHKNEPSGFCFVNDIVMAISELLKKHERIFYIDIDVHHGDGVEEAFFFEDRVLTLSLHKFGNGYFPETGSLITTNHKAINVPLLSGIDDETYKYVFEPLVDTCIKKFNPSVIVMQCGADSLAEDRLGVFNLSIKGHASCLKYIKTFGIPLMILGGGGYTLTNVARCWAYETALICGEENIENIPSDNPFYSYFSPSYSIAPDFKKKISNKNDKEYIDAISGFIYEKIEKF